MHPPHVHSKNRNLCCQICFFIYTIIKHKTDQTVRRCWSPVNLVTASPPSAPPRTAWETARSISVPVQLFLPQPRSITQCSNSHEFKDFLEICVAYAGHHTKWVCVLRFWQASHFQRFLAQTGLFIWFILQFSILLLFLKLVLASLRFIWWT